MYRINFFLLAVVAILVESNPVDKISWSTNNQRIFNGSPSEPGQFPFYTLLQLKKENGQETLCGGSLISDQWVLTAGHCVEGAYQAIAYLGVTEIPSRTEEGRWGGISQEIFMHPERIFDKHLGSFNDLALIKLPEPVEFSKTIQPVKLPTSCAANTNSEVFAIGNGIENEDVPHHLSSILQYAQLSTIPLNVCNHIVRNIPLAPENKIICAIGNGQKSVCAGDSGGPLVRKNDTVLVGVTSIGVDKSCGMGYPSIFVDVTQHFEWISQITGLEMPQC